MTKKEAVKEYCEFVLPKVRRQYEQDGRKDASAQAEAWNNFTDYLCKEGRITLCQYETWTHPR